MSEEVHSKRSGLGSQCKELGQRKGSKLENRAVWRPGKRWGRETEACRILREEVLGT